MSNVFEFGRRASAKWLMEHLHGFAHEVGLNEAKVRQIVRKIIIDMPLHTDEERLEWARNWMLAASARS
jgi:hypothetical protein